MGKGTGHCNHRQAISLSHKDTVKKYTNVFVDTDQYTGNFEREMGAYLFKAMYYYDHHEQELVDSVPEGALTWAHDPDNGTSLLEVLPSDHANEYTEITSVPKGFLSDNAKGTHASAIRFKLNRHLTQAEIRQLKDRVKGFPSWYNKRLASYMKHSAIGKIQLRVEKIEQKINTQSSTVQMPISLKR